MFTGIVEELGAVAALERTEGGGATVDIQCTTVVADAAVGDSISVNGCCLTVTALTGFGFTSDLMGETLDRTALGGLAIGSPVNLERAVRADGRLGGHLVQGHVDAVGQILAVEPHEDWTTLRIQMPQHLAACVAEKGSITVDGTSLTVMHVTDDQFAVGLIPHTLAVTTLGTRRAGDRVNLEVDVIAKYVERMLSHRFDPARRSP